MTAFVQYGFNTVFEYIIERDETTLGGNIYGITLTVDYTLMSNM